MDSKDLLEVFDRETQCEYKDRQYLVRDNGAILRLPKEGCKPGKWDNVWTFGTKDERTGYMFFAGNVRVHQVVCTAFHGPEPQPHMVVDHIDTNRCNNRPENLRWLTRIENALNNDATRKKIIYLCGSVEAFIENPAILRTKALPPDVRWMKTVTKEEAAACKKHIDEWATRDSKPQGTGKGLGDWVFSDEEMVEAAKWNGGSAYPGYKTKAQREAEIAESWRQYEKENFGLKDSLTPGAKQLGWKTPTEFPQIPQKLTATPLQDYLARLPKGAIYTRNRWGESTVFDAAISEDGSHLAVITEISGVTHYALSEVTFEDSSFVHKSIRTFFTEEGAQKDFTESRGLEWTGGDVMEDYC